VSVRTRMRNGTNNGLGFPLNLKVCSYTSLYFKSEPSPRDQACALYADMFFISLSFVDPHIKSTVRIACRTIAGHNKMPVNPPTKPR
jgi:hypothetical protein